VEVRGTDLAEEDLGEADRAGDLEVGLVVEDQGGDREEMGLGEVDSVVGTDLEEDREEADLVVIVLGEVDLLGEDREVDPGEIDLVEVDSAGEETEGIDLGGAGSVVEDQEETGKVGERVEGSERIVLTEGRERCIKLNARIVKRNVRFLSSQQKASRFIVMSAFLNIRSINCFYLRPKDLSCFSSWSWRCDESVAVSGSF